MFIPVMFACLTSGQCMFFSDKPVFKLEKCQEKKERMEQLADDSPHIVNYATACIKIEGGQDA